MKTLFHSWVISMTLLLGDSYAPDVDHERSSEDTDDYEDDFDSVDATILIVVFVVPVTGCVICLGIVAILMCCLPQSHEDPDEFHRRTPRVPQVIAQPVILAQPIPLQATYPAQPVPPQIIPASAPPYTATAPPHAAPSHLSPFLQYLPEPAQITAQNQNGAQMSSATWNTGNLSPDEYRKGLH